MYVFIVVRVFNDELVIVTSGVIDCPAVDDDDIVLLWSGERDEVTHIENVNSGDIDGKIEIEAVEDIE